MTVPSFGNYPNNYLLFNKQLSKNLALVLEIQGIPTLFGVADTFTRIRYGDQGITYGLPGVVYGGLRSMGQVRPYIILDSGLTVQQRIEPESGRGNIGNITINLVDYNGEVSFMLAPGNVVPEIMGQLCTLRLGYTETSYPEDFVIVYRGYVTNINCPPGKVSLQISDATMKTRQPIFDIGSATLIDPIPGTASGPNSVLVALSNTDVLHKQILGPDGTYDSTVSTYLVIDSEIFEYGATGILSATGVLCTPGQLGTGATGHSAGTAVNGSIGFGFNSEGINCIELVLKWLLSGWDGPCWTDQPILSFVFDYNGNFASNEFVLNDVDAYFDLGLAPGDYFYITGSASGNSVSGQITGLEIGAEGAYNIIQTDQTFNLENPTSALVAFRSQYDTFPITSGLMCTTADVDVQTFQLIRSNFFSAAGASNLRGYYDSAVDALDTICTDVMLPMGCYNISRYGRISMAVTKPPLPGSGTKLVQLDYTNVCDPDKITVTRSLNQRSFYNEISYEYDFDVANQTYNSIQYFLDTQSLNQFGIVVVLPIQAKTVSSALGGSLIAQSRGGALLKRFSHCLIWIELTVLWEVGSLIEVSDIVLLKDQGTLQIMNFNTGKRDIGVDLYEVIDRNYQIVDGNVKLKLLGGLGFDVSSRFGLYSPSSTIQNGSTTTNIRVTPSWGQKTLPNEIGKWTPLAGLPIMVHDYAWSVSGMSILQGANPGDGAGLLVAPPLPFAPTSGMILDIAPYPTDGNPLTDQMLKKLYAHYTPTVPVATGFSPELFQVAPGSGSLFTIGNTCVVRSADYSTYSEEVKVVGASGDIISVAAPLSSEGNTFVPTTGFFVEGIGFNDHLGYYRYD